MLVIVYTTERSSVRKGANLIDGPMREGDRGAYGNVGWHGDMG